MGHINNLHKKQCMGLEDLMYMFTAMIYGLQMPHHHLVQ